MPYQLPYTATSQALLQLSICQSAYESPNDRAHKSEGLDLGRTVVAAKGSRPPHDNGRNHGIDTKILSDKQGF
jgi:hypothetical protein